MEDMHVGHRVLWLRHALDDASLPRLGALDYNAINQRISIPLDSRLERGLMTIRNCAGFVISLLLPGLALASTIYFDSESDLDQFNVRFTRNEIAHQPGEGILGSGAIGISGDREGFAEMTWKARSFRFTEPTDSVQSSYRFRYFEKTEPPLVITPDSRSGFSVATLYLHKEPFPVSPAPHMQAGLLFFENDDDSAYLPELRVEAIDNSGVYQRWSMPALTNGNWYRLGAVFSPGDPLLGRPNMSVWLDDMGADGASVNQSLGHFSTAIPTLNQWATPTAFAGFSVARRGRDGAGGSIYVDEFTVIPTPASFPLLAMAFLGLGMRRRR